MENKIPKASYAYFALTSLLSDQESLLKDLHTGDCLDVLPCSNKEIDKISTYLSNVSRAIKKVEEGSHDNDDVFKIIFPKPITVWQDSLGETIEDKVNILMLETQTYSLFHYQIILGNALEETVFKDISYHLFDILKTLYINNRWSPSDLSNLNNHWEERLSAYYKAYITGKEKQDFLVLARLVSRNMLRTNDTCLKASMIISLNTSTVLTYKTPLFIKYASRIER